MVSAIPVSGFGVNSQDLDRSGHLATRTIKIDYRDQLHLYPIPKGYLGERVIPEQALCYALFILTRLQGTAGQGRENPKKPYFFLKKYLTIPRGLL